MPSPDDEEVEVDACRDDQNGDLFWPKPLTPRRCRVEGVGLSVHKLTLFRVCDKKNLKKENPARGKVLTSSLCPKPQTLVPAFVKAPSSAKSLGQRRPELQGLTLTYQNEGRPKGGQSLTGKSRTLDLIRFC